MGDPDGPLRNIIGSVLGLLVAAAAVVGFGFLLYSLLKDPTIDTTKTERLMRDRIQEEQGLTLSNVSCPEDVKVAKDTTFDCNAKVPSGRPTQIEALQVSDEGDLRIRIKPGTLPLDATKLEESLKQRLKDDNEIETLSIECPEDRYQKLGEAFTCTAVDNNNQRGNLDVEITSDGGQYRYVIRQ